MYNKTEPSVFQLLMALVAILAIGVLLWALNSMEDYHEY